MAFRQRHGERGAGPRWRGDAFDHFFGRGTGQPNACVMTEVYRISVAESAAPYGVKPEILQRVEDPIGLKVEGCTFKTPTIQHMQRGTEPDKVSQMENVYNKSQGNEWKSFS